MARFLKSRDKVLGKSLDDVVFIGSQKVDKPFISVVSYSAQELTEAECHSPLDCAAYLDSDHVTWISVYGLHDTSFIQQFARGLHLHPLVLEDVVNTGQHPKMDDYDDTIYLVLKSLRFNPETESVLSDQYSMIIGANVLVTFHEQPMEMFKPIRERLRKGKGRTRKRGTDYLAYVLLDAIVDNYIVTIENLGSRIEEIDDSIFKDFDQEIVSAITRYKREVSYLRKTIRPVKDLIGQLIKVESDLISEETLPFLKDLHGLTTQAVEVLETYREMLSDSLNTYNTIVSNRLNEIMKVLTIFAAIFIPLTFIAGIYGTNFEYLPELRYKYSYFVFWVVLVAVAALMLRFFKKKGWL